MAEKDCSCGKPSTPPLGKPQPPAGGLTSKTQSFRVSTEPGQTFSMLEARAAAVRRGGGTITPA